MTLVNTPGMNDQSVVDAAANAQGATGQLSGLDPSLADAVQRLVLSSGGRLAVASGLRTPAEQQALYQGYANIYGPQGALNFVAAPGSSNHETGNAVDLQGDWSSIAQLAPQYGLYQPMPYEPWHVELASQLHNSTPQSYAIAPQGQMMPSVDTARSDPSYQAASLAQALSMASQQGLEMGPEGLQSPPSNVQTAPANQQFSGMFNPATPTLGNQMADALSGASQGQTPAAGSSGAAGAGAPNLAYTPGGGPFGGVDQQKFATAFLKGLGAPVTPENMKFVTAWEAAESGGGGGANNPLNTTEDMPGATAYNYNNGDPVKNYQSFQDGVAANLQALTNGRYQGIIDALMQGNNAMTAAQALAASPWGTGGLVAKILAGR